MKKKFNVEKAYYLFLLTRKSEEKIIELYNTDKIKSPVHLSIGQEAIAVGVNMAISEDEVIFSNYRGHAHYIAREANLDKMWAELYGKSRGTARGKGGSMHLNDWGKKFMPTSAIVSTAIPQAVGYAYALKYKNQKGVVICYHGDGATDEGVFWESLNFASLHSLPIIFICENNKYAIYTHQDKRAMNDPIVERARAFGVNATKIKGSSTEDFYNATIDCLNNIEKESKPHLIECNCLRWRDHVGVGDARDLNYRNEKEVDEAITNDDLLSLEKKLPISTVNAIKLKVDSQINNAVRFAEDSKFPEVNELYDNVYG
ncbi:MAG: thiamine pyrophosphate-dependent dehydrogenase E1 component subunit alpha [Gammaproteobacteria bacterium]|jgi:TPP-dependent pyruvate/acetoin dehydrogenase alpha subunit|nr:thiamine pyrophosphate-dependent dehydrogenase E1 component subunit alpha [Gammaproteobacteria bacterium]